MANELTECPHFGLRAGAQGVELFRELGGRARNFTAVTHIHILQKTCKRRRRGLLVLRGRGRSQDEGKKYSWNQFAQSGPPLTGNIHLMAEDDAADYGDSVTRS